MKHPLRKPLITTLVLLSLYGLFLAWSFVQGHAKARALGAGPPDEKIDIVVYLDFVPKAYHMTTIQQLGQIAKIEGNTLYLRDVDRREANALLRRYWVTAAQLWTEGG